MDIAAELSAERKCQEPLSTSWKARLQCVRQRARLPHQQLLSAHGSCTIMESGMLAYTLTMGFPTYSRCCSALAHGTFRTCICGGWQRKHHGDSPVERSCSVQPAYRPDADVVTSFRRVPNRQRVGMRMQKSAVCLGLAAG